MQIEKYRKPIKVFLSLILVYFVGRWYIWNVEMYPSVTSLTFSPDSKTLAGSADWRLSHSKEVEGLSVVRLWDAQSGQTKHRLGSLPKASWVLFSPDGKKIASGDIHDRCSIWNSQSGKQEQSNVPVPSLMSGFSYLPVNRRFHWFGDQEAHEKWRATEKELLVLKAKINKSECYPVAMSRDTTLAAFIEAGDSQRSLQIWNVATGKLQKTLGSGKWYDRGIAFSPSGKILAVADYSNTVSIFDVSSGRLLQTVKTQRVELPKHLAISPDGSKLAMGDFYGPVELWDLKSEKLVFAEKFD